MVWHLGWYKASGANMKDEKRMNWVLRGEVIIIWWNSEIQSPRTQVLVQAAIINWEMKSTATVNGKEKMRNLSAEAAHKIAVNNIFNVSWFSNRWERNQYELQFGDASSKILCTILVIAVG